MEQLTEFLGKIRKIHGLMTLVATGQVDRSAKEQEYKSLHNELKSYFQSYGIADPNFFESLEEFYGYYRSKFPHYEQRRQFITRMYESVENQIEVALSQGRAMEMKVQPIITKSAPIGGPDPQKVLIVYGRNEHARVALFTFLRAIGLHPLEWAELVRATGEGSPYIGNILQKGFSDAQAVVVLLTPDDVGMLKREYQKADDPAYEKELTGQPRLNVIFEAGMAFGFCPERTVMVQLGNSRPFSDTLGRHVVKLDNTTEKRQELAQRLQTLHCTVNLAGTDWHRAGNFNVEKAASGSDVLMI